MNYEEIIEKVALLTSASYELEAAYIENGGEITEETEALEAVVENTRALLEGDGIDALGEWLKSLEDRKASLKAEKEFVDRRIKATDNTIAFVKHTVSSALAAIGTDKVKGSRGYSFTASLSRTVKADAALLKERYQKTALDAIHGAGIPSCVTVTLGASSSLVDGDLPDFFSVNEENTVTFRKPKAAKKEDE